jgi:SAM-dependent methyltransferase
MTKSEKIQYICMPIEDISFSEKSFDVVISSLAFHYIRSFEDICIKVARYLINGGSFVFSVEHPIFTAYGTQDWYYDEKGKSLHWPVDNYFSEGIRKANFLGEEVLKYHKTLTTYINTLIKTGFEITELIEPEPAPELLNTIPEMSDELRRPMMLLISAIKK